MSGQAYPFAVEAPAPAAELRAHLRAGWPRAARWGGGVFAAGLVLAALLPPSYRATATLAVLPAPEFTVRADAGAHSSNNSALAMDQIMKAETEILNSDSLHAATLDSVSTARVYPSLANANDAPWLARTAHAALRALLAPWRPAPVDADAARAEQALRNFSQDVRVLPSKDGNIITVTFANRAGATAAAVVNAMLAHYAARRGQLYDDPQLRSVRAEAAASAQAVQAADAALAGFKLRQGISDSATERGLLLRRQSDAAQALADAQAEAGAAGAQRDALDGAIRATPASVNLYTEHDPDTRLAAIDASLVTLRGTLAAARVHYRDNSRTIADLLAQLRARTTERAALANPATPSIIRTGRSQAIDLLLLDRARAAATAAAAGARAAAISAQLREIALALRRMTQDETTLAALSRAKSVADGNFANISRVMAEQKLTEAEDALRMANVRVIQPALVPQRPTVVPLLVIVAGALLGMLAAVVSFVDAYALRPTCLTALGLAHATGVPVLGVFGAQEREQGGGLRPRAPKLRAAAG